MSRLAGVLKFALTVVRMANEHEVRYPAAALAYYPFVSLLPVLLLALAVTGRQTAGRIQTLTPRVLTPETSQLVYESMTAASGRVGAALFAVGVLIWSAGNVASGFATIVERVEGRPDRSIPVRVRDAICVLGSLALALVSTILTSATFALLPVGPLVVGAGLVALLAALTVSFLPLYYVPSRSVTSVTGALPGALAAAVGWTVLLAVIHLYATNASRYAVYGVLSGVLLVLTAFYAGATVLLLGIVVNAAVAGEVDAADSGE